MRGELLCQGFEAYRQLLPSGQISFEHAYFLVNSLSCGKLLRLANCVDCGALMVTERLSPRHGLPELPVVSYRSARGGRSGCAGHIDRCANRTAAMSLAGCRQYRARLSEASVYPAARARVDTHNRRTRWQAHRM